MKEILKIENLTHIYGAGTPFEKKAVDGADFSVSSGEFIVIAGHTGSGKSTMIKHLNGLLKPSSGRVLFCGQDIWQTPGLAGKLRFEVGLVFQYPEYQLFEETVGRDIAFGPRNMGLSDTEIDERVRIASKLVGIDDEMLEKSPFDLSGGQKRRAAIAGVLAMLPKVLVLDEPTAGLDPQGRAEILSLVKNYAAEGERAVVLVTHSMEDAAETATRIIVMRGGKIAADGTREQIFSDSALIESSGLETPQISRVAELLRAEGMDIGRDVFTVDEAAEALEKWFKAGNYD